MSDEKSKGIKFDGVLSAAQMLSKMDKPEREKLLKNIEKKDPLMADKIRQRMFTFEDLTRIEDPGLQLLLRAIPRDKLVLALRNMPNEFKEALLKNVSTRTATQIKEDILSQGAQKLSLVTSVQEEIAQVSRTLLEEGKIFLKK